MSRALRILFILAGLALLAVAAGVLALSQVGRTSAVDLGDATGPVAFALETVVPTGLVQPTHLTHAGDGSGLLYVVEQGGRIRILDGDTILEEPLLDITPQVDRSTWEQGLLSVAFHPDFAENDRFFVYYSRAGTGDGVVAEYRRTDEGSEHVVDLFAFPSPARIHYGGQLAFGPDGYLYLSVGDGHQRAERFPEGRLLPQLLDNHAGKILRVDVDGDAPWTVPPDNPFVDREGALPEIWAYGLRNPWRFSFDRATGEIFTGDVGHIDVESVVELVPGANYAWPYYEGPDCRVPGWRGRVGCLLASLRNDFTRPIAFYRHLPENPDDELIEGRDSGKVGGNSITGGFVYRGEAFPELQGRLFIADFISGSLWSLARDGDRWVDDGVIATGMLISSFGEDEAGELFLVDWALGAVHRLVAR